MGRLFGRVSRIVVGSLDVSGFRVRFDVTKTLKPEPNSASVEVFGLSSDHRSELAGLVSARTPGTPKVGYGARPVVGVVPVLIEAGYRDTGPQTLFRGDLLVVDSVRSGASWSTIVGAGDAAKAIRSARVSQALGPNTQVREALKTLLGALGLGTGNLSSVLGALATPNGATLYPRGVVLTGSVSKRLTEVCRSCGLEWSVQDGAVQLLSLGGVLPGSGLRLTPETGLIGSPTVDQDGVLSAETLLLPGLRCGGLVVVESAHVQGSFRVESLSARGDTHGAEWGYAIQARRVG